MTQEIILLALILAILSAIGFVHWTMARDLGRIRKSFDTVVVEFLSRIIQLDKTTRETIKLCDTTLKEIKRFEEALGGIPEKKKEPETTPEFKLVCEKLPYEKTELRALEMLQITYNHFLKRFHKDSKPALETIWKPIGEPALHLWRFADPMPRVRTIAQMQRCSNRQPQNKRGDICRTLSVKMCGKLISYLHDYSRACDPELMNMFIEKGY